MNTLSFESLAAYWSVNEISTNVVVFLNIFGALLLGWSSGTNVPFTDVPPACGPTGSFAWLPLHWLSSLGIQATGTEATQRQLP